ncbi:MAG: heavy metal translocating P-type ATPase [Gammaproteobacteria bacterium]|nr:heavy metal translocating P-type ATPase [Gammaproteobacteria bacterium]
MSAMTSDCRHSARLASLVPGRLRIKLHRREHAPGMLERIKSRLEAHEGVHRVRVNPANGSLTLHYDPHQHGTAGVLGLLEDVDVMVESIGHLPSIDGGEGASAAGFIGAADDLNRRIRRFTGVPVDLKLALPMLFLAAGVWSTLRKGLMIEAVPGWLFLWFAFDMFVKLHSQSQTDAGSSPKPVTGLPPGAD